MVRFKKTNKKTVEQKGLMGFTNRIWHFLVEIKKNVAYHIIIALLGSQKYLSIDI